MQSLPIKFFIFGVYNIELTADNFNFFIMFFLNASLIYFFNVSNYLAFIL